MVVSPRIPALVVPMLIFIGGLAFLFQVLGARWSVVVVPYSVVGLLALALGLDVWQEFRKLTQPEQDAAEQEQRGEASLSFRGTRTAARQAGLLGLCVLYYICFIYAGFSVANVMFLILSSMLISRNFLSAFFLSMLVSIAMYIISNVMELRTPDKALDYILTAVG